MFKYLVVFPGALLALAMDCSLFGIDTSDAGDITSDSGYENYVASCVHDATWCTDIYVSPALDAASLVGDVSTGCGAHGYTFSATRCPTANRAGTCAATDTLSLSDGGSVTIYPFDRFYGTLTGDPVSACAAHGGVWTSL